MTNLCRPLRLVLVSSLLITSLLSGARSHRLFVSTSGNDRNSGRTMTEALQSINEAIRRAVADDTVCVLPGTYRELVRWSDKHGVPEHPICLMGSSQVVGEYPVIDGGAATPSSNASNDWMTITNCDWIEVSRIRFIRGWTFPIKVDGSSYLTFRECQFSGGKRVINAGGASTHHILVEDCSWDQGGEFLWKVEFDTRGVPAWTSMHHGDMAYFNGSLFDCSGTGGSMVLRRNTIVNAFNGIRFRGRVGYDANVEIYGNRVSRIRDNDFEPEYFAYNLHIYNNVSHNIHKTLSVDNVEGGLIYYYGNVVTADTDAWSETICIGLWKVFGRQRFLTYPVYAFNNSFAAPGIAFNNMGGIPRSFQHFNNAYFFLKSGGWQLNGWHNTDEFDFDITNRPWPSSLTTHGQESHGTVADILFVDAVAGDLRLRTGSPGIGAGKRMEFKDLDWVQSRGGPTPDIGAYQNGKLINGPPFRFMVPPIGTLSYKEKPRIVRHDVDGSKVTLYFSDQLDPSSVTKDDLELYQGDDRVRVQSVSFPRNHFELVAIAAGDMAVDSLAVRFTRMPTGRNGERATYWASTVRIHR